MNARIKKKIKKRDGYKKYNSYYIAKLYSLFPDDETTNYMIYVIGNNIKHPHKILLLSNFYPIGISNVTMDKEEALEETLSFSVEPVKNSKIEEAYNSVKEMLNAWVKAIEEESN